MITFLLDQVRRRLGLTGVEELVVDVGTEIPGRVGVETVGDGWYCVFWI
jgi:hypothetical protein